MNYTIFSFHLLQISNANVHISSAVLSLFVCHLQLLVTEGNGKYTSKFRFNREK